MTRCSQAGGDYIPVERKVYSSVSSFLHSLNKYLLGARQVLGCGDTLSRHGLTLRGTEMVTRTPEGRLAAAATATVSRGDLATPLSTCP